MTHDSLHEGPYLFDVGVIALAHTDAPVRDVRERSVTDRGVGVCERDDPDVEQVWSFVETVVCHSDTDRTPSCGRIGLYVEQLQSLIRGVLRATTDCFSVFPGDGGGVVERPRLVVCCRFFYEPLHPLDDSVRVLGGLDNDSAVFLVDRHLGPRSYFELLSDLLWEHKPPLRVHRGHVPTTSGKIINASTSGSPALRSYQLLPFLLLFRQPRQMRRLLDDYIPGAEPGGVLATGQTEDGHAVGDAGGRPGADHLRADLLVG